MNAFNKGLKEYGVTNSSPSLFQIMNDNLIEFNNDRRSSIEVKFQYYSASVPVIQSSGAGKTLKVIKMMRTECFGIYFNVRNNKNNGFPPSYPKIHNYFNDTIIQVNELILLYYIIFMHFNTFLNVKSNFIGDHSNIYIEWYDLSSSEDFQLNLLKQLKESYHDRDEDPILINNGQDGIVTFYLKELYLQIQSLWILCEISIDKLNMSTAELKFVFSYDEMSDICRETRNNIVRSFALHYCIGYFAVMTDTNSSLFQMAPSIQAHASNRVAIRNQQLFRPYIKFDKYEPNFLNTMTFKELMKCEIQFSIGRRLFSSLISVNTDLKELLRLAYQKLLSDTNDPNNKYLAILNQLTPFSIRPREKRSEQLVESNMATIISISEFRTSLTYTYLNEPILACAALHAIFHTNQLTEAMKFFRDITTEGITDVGQIGEVIGSLLLIIVAGKCYGYEDKYSSNIQIETPPSMRSNNTNYENQDTELNSLESDIKSLNLNSNDNKLNSNDQINTNTNNFKTPQKIQHQSRKINLKSKYSHDLSYTTLGTFLNTLITYTDQESMNNFLNSNVECTIKTAGNESSNKDTVNHDLSNGKINFRQFIRTKAMISKQLLVELFMRGCALFFEENHPGADLCIPVFLGNENDIVTVNNITAVFIQIKNLKSVDDESNRKFKSTVKLLWSNVVPKDPIIEVDYVALYMDLGADFDSKSVHFECLKSYRHTRQSAVNLNPLQKSISMNGVNFAPLFCNIGHNDVPLLIEYFQDILSCGRRFGSETYEGHDPIIFDKDFIKIN